VRTHAKLQSIGAVVERNHENPFELLGPHVVEENGRQSMAVRAFLPESQQAWVVHGGHGHRSPMRKIHPAGVFEAICPLPDDVAAGSYQLSVASKDGHMSTMHDPYSFPTLLSDYDIHLLGEGAHWRSYERLGAQVCRQSGVLGTNFAVWAPNADSVSVIGGFNRWDDRPHQLKKHVPSGIWEIFIPELMEGAVYKYRLKVGEQILEKADPYGFAAELPPCTASVVADLSKHRWADDAWLQERSGQDPTLPRPISIYEVHLGSWMRDESRVNGWLSYQELAHRLVEYCHKMGFTHLELMPINEHPYSGSWGYQTVGYFAATSRYGSPDDFMYFVDHCHQNDIGVILDWVPAHFPRDAHGLRQFDGSALYEHSDPRQGEHPDWGTMIFNYGRNEVRNFLISNALFWFDKYHIDGLRVDAVASMLYLDYSREDGQWIPNAYGGRENLEAVTFLKQFNEQSHGQFPGVLTIAEESTAWGGVTTPTFLGGLGFNLKWNMGWMNDTLRFMHDEPVHRKHHHDELTFSLIYAFSENFALPFSHDEVVHGKGALLDQMPGDLWQKFANLRLLYSYMWTHPGKKLLFMGGEFGQWNEWNHEASLQWELLEHDTHRGVQRMVADLNQLLRREPALYEVDFDGAGFEWIDAHCYDESMLAYLRKAADPNDFLLVCCNFTPVVRPGRRIGVPHGGWYREIFNSDSEYYGGGNVGSHPGVEAEEIEAQGRPFSLSIDLPPLGVTIFKPER